MHEMAYVEELLKKLRNLKLKKVLRINLSINRISGIEPKSFTFYWKAVTKNTLFSQTKLKFRKITNKTLCLSCKKHFLFIDDDDILIRCPFCGSIKTVQKDNSVVTIESIEFEET